MLKWSVSNLTTSHDFTGRGILSWFLLSWISVVISQKAWMRLTKILEELKERKPDKLGEIIDSKISGEAWKQPESRRRICFKGLAEISAESGSKGEASWCAYFLILTLLRDGWKSHWIKTYRKDDLCGQARSREELRTSIISKKSCYNSKISCNLIGAAKLSKSAAFPMNKS